MKLAGLCSFALIGLFAACSSSSENASDPQTPPTSGRTDIEQWLRDASYKTWKCELAVHAARDPSPHGFNRICSNDVIAAAATGTSAWPKGAAAVKEIYASMTATEPVGYAVHLKTDADSAGGSNWYWYERVPADSIAPHDANGSSLMARAVTVPPSRSASLATPPPAWMHHTHPRRVGATKSIPRFTERQARTSGLSAVVRQARTSGLSVVAVAVFESTWSDTGIALSASSS